MPPEPPELLSAAVFCDRVTTPPKLVLPGVNVTPTGLRLDA